ncbi:endonuclease V [Deinococcus rubellus]|uniref:Endonuclease V n=1 Tax=Deinococcus rubellus TaxID=1889240 RepID=A0ABY5YEW5_9DEIO|nr:endonuclease V [Deinococcus rubellus]UWX63256.1 endonuclease V [Deinococcus rubellus]
MTLPELACTDVDYHPDGSARTAALLFGNWSDAREARAILHTSPQVAAYQPRAFYLRELPCLLAALEPLADQLEVVIIDGYVTLDAAGRPGLGWHLFRALGQRVAVIGVAKTAFQGSAHALPVERGQSQRPLFVTAAGLEPAQAASFIRQMAGPHRLPTLLKRVDQACRAAP